MAKDFKLQCEVKGHVVEGSMYFECTTPHCLFCGEWMSEKGEWFEADADNFNWVVDQYDGKWGVSECGDEEKVVATFDTKEEADNRRKELLAEEGKHWYYKYKTIYERIHTYVGYLGYLHHEMYTHKEDLPEMKRCWEKHREAQGHLETLFEKLDSSPTQSSSMRL